MHAQTTRPPFFPLSSRCGKEGHDLPRRRTTNGEMCIPSAGADKSSENASNPTNQSAAAANGTANKMDNSKANDSSSNGKSKHKPITTADSSIASSILKRRCKRDRQKEWAKQQSSLSVSTSTSPSSKRIVKKKKKSNMTAKHQNDSRSGGIDALLPSLAGVIILGIAIMAKMGFRGRATVAGIDLGTTNSVICVQSQEKGGELYCYDYCA
jgi:hypothetical protein